MLFPRFSIRAILAAMIGVALVAFVARLAMQSVEWAAAVMVLILLVASAFAIWGMLFVFCSLVGGTLSSLFRSPAVAAPSKSPFADEHVPPPQIIAQSETPLD